MLKEKENFIRKIDNGRVFLLWRQIKQKLQRITNLNIMKNSENKHIQSQNRNTVLSAVEILNNKYNEMQIVADEYYLKLLKNCFDKNSRKVFDEIISGMGTLAFYKKNEPLFEHEERDIKYIEEINDFLNEWDDVLKLTGNYIIINKDGISVNQ